MDITLLRTLLNYDPAVGGLINAVDRHYRAKAGTRAGTLKPSGYRSIYINGKGYLEHRLIWMWHHGVMPTMRLDHINGVKDDNRIENLRECTQAQNMANQGKHRTNTSGHKGVSWNKRHKKWRTRIGVNYKKIHIGYFTNPEDAAAAYKTAALKYQAEFAKT